MSFPLMLLIITALVSFVREPVEKDWNFKMEMETQHTFIGIMTVKTGDKVVQIISKAWNEEWNLKKNKLNINKDYWFNFLFN